RSNGTGSAAAATDDSTVRASSASARAGAVAGPDGHGVGRRRHGRAARAAFDPPIVTPAERRAAPIETSLTEIAVTTRTLIRARLRPVRIDNFARVRLRPSGGMQPQPRTRDGTASGCEVGGDVWMIATETTGRNWQRASMAIAGTASGTGVPAAAGGYVGRG